MNEIKIKPKTVLILVVLLFCAVCFYAGITNNCQRNSAETYTGNAKIIFAITPTYDRPVQKAELTRLAHTIKLMPNIHWIIIEDADSTSSKVVNILDRLNLKDRSTVLNAKTPADFKLKEKDPNWSKPRGVEQRNLGLTWVRNYLKKHPKIKSVVYFMDDDNTYSLELFHQMNLIKDGKVGVWPVGLVGGLMVEKPVLNDDNEVIGFNSAWRPERPFPLDMAGFGISSDLLLLYPEAVFSYDIQRGYQESEILRHLTVVRDLQPLGNLCKEVLVWHTRTEAPKLDAEIKLRKTGQRSDGGMEV